MKANYPVEFLAASMTLDTRQHRQAVGIPRRGRSASASRSSAPIDQSLGRDLRGRRQRRSIYALAALKGVGAQAVELDRRGARRRPFTSLADFAARVNPRAINKRVIESLAAAGAFDTLDANRARVFGGADTILAACQRSHEAATIGQNDMFGGAADAPTIVLPQIEPWLPAERLRREYDAIGFFLSGHPLDDYATVLKRLRVQSWAEFSQRGQDRCDGGQGRGDRGVAHGAPHQDRQQDGHHRPVRSHAGTMRRCCSRRALPQYRDLLEPGTAVLLLLSAEVQGEDVRARIQTVERL